jgi:hypothetical protein
MEPDCASKWGDFEIDIVPNHELEVSTPVICITLLSALSNPQVLSYLGASLIFVGPKNNLSPTSNHIRGVLHFLPYKVSNGDILRLA